jgi:hypothetical protein
MVTNNVGVLLMLHLLHLSPDVHPMLMARMMSVDHETARLAEARRLLGVAQAYLPVAWMPEADEPADIILATSPGQSLEWRVLPPQGLYPIGPRMTRSGNWIDARPTRAGDVICANRVFHLANADGFSLIGRVAKSPKLPQDPVSLIDEGYPIHMPMADQKAVAAEVCRLVLEDNVWSFLTAEEIMTKRGYSPFKSSIIAAEAVRLAVLQSPEHFVVKDAPLSCCLVELAQRGMMPASPEQVTRILASDPSYCDRLNHLYVTAEDGLDTREREELLDIVARHLAGRVWPANMDTEEEVSAFADALASGMEREGWSRPTMSLAPV